MAKKTPRVYTLDELKEKSQKALADPKLVEIVKSAPLNKDGKVNCTWAYKEAEKYVHDQTKDLQKTKELAVATRFLAMLRREFTDEFEKLVAREKQPEIRTIPVVTKKKFREIEFELPMWNENGVKLISETRRYDGKIISLYTIRFYDNEEWPFDTEFGARETARKLCMKILNALVETAPLFRDTDLLNDLIQLLEEKFGLKVKVCENCKYFTPDHLSGKGCDPQEKFLPWFGACTYPIKTGNYTMDYRPLGKPNYCCDYWAPKESPKKEN